MDDRRFDRLAKSMAGTSRRSLLKGAFGALLGGALGLPGLSNAAAAGRPVSSICRKNGDCASGVCGPKDATGRQRCVCANSTDCPAPAGTCTIATCTTGVCGTAPGNTGTPCGQAADSCSPAPVCSGSATVCPPALSACANGEVCGSDGTCESLQCFCPSGQMLLANGTCATPCTSSEPDNCGNRCIETSDGNLWSAGGADASCNSSNLDCPVGTACSGAFCEQVCGWTGVCGSPVCSVCPSGQTLLANGSCATPCTSSEPDNCGNRCIETSDGNLWSAGGADASCNSSNLDCPVGTACSGAFCEQICGWTGECGVPA